MAQSTACQEAIWIQNIMKEMDVSNVSKTVINADNQGAIKLACNPEYHKRTKHIDIRYHWIRELITTKQIELTYRPTSEMVADGLTKALSKDRFEQFKAAMGVGVGYLVDA